MAYFANGTEGEILDRQCDECIVGDDDPCPILLVQQFFNYEQHGNEPLKKCLNALVDKKGECQMKLILDRLGEEKVEPIPIPKSGLRNYWKERGL